MQTNQIEVLKQTELCGQQFKLYGSPEEPLFLAKDVATIINHSDVSMMMRSIDEEEKVTNIVCTPGGNQQMLFLTEDGLYEVLMQSRKPVAKQFKKGVKTILKEIRKKGGYIAAREEDTPDMIMARAVLLAQDTIEKQKLILKTQEQQLQIQAPKVEYYDKTLSSTGLLTANMIAQSIGIGVIKLNQLLCAWNIQYKQSGCYFLHAIYRDKGLAQHKSYPYTLSDGTVKTCQHLYWTEKGKEFIINTYNRKMGAKIQTMPTITLEPTFNM